MRSSLKLTWFKCTAVQCIVTSEEWNKMIAAMKIVTEKLKLRDLFKNSHVCSMTCAWWCQSFLLGDPTSILSSLLNYDYPVDSTTTLLTWALQRSQLNRSFEIQHTSMLVLVNWSWAHAMRLNITRANLVNNFVIHFLWACGSDYHVIGKSRTSPYLFLKVFLDEHKLIIMTCSILIRTIT